MLILKSVLFLFCASLMRESIEGQEADDSGKLLSYYGIR